MQSILVHIFHNHAGYGRFSYILQPYLLYCKIFYCIFIIWQYLDLIKDKQSKNMHHSILNIFVIRQVKGQWVAVAIFQFETATIWSATETATSDWMEE
jgi:hypothetical protein